jgi:CubicO group peptidase (beta-lactamase class C family)
MNLNRRARAVLALASLFNVSGCAGWRVDQAAQTATGFASHLLCDDVFVTGADADTAFAERVAPMAGVALPLFNRRIDRERREVSVTVAGGFESRARYREGVGCQALPSAELAGQAEPAPPVRPTLAASVPFGSALQLATDPQLSQVIERALVEPSGGPVHRTKAVVVLKDGRLIAEHYAPGYGADTPVLGFSATKSVTNALIGILVRQGKLALDQPAPVPEWRDPADPHHGITLEHLLRQTSGLDLPQDNSGFDASARIMYSVRDKAAAVGAAPLAVSPGTRWAYADTNYLLLGRIVRDAVGGSGADVMRFAHDELFGPLGMHHVVLDFDTTGTPIAASHLLASARDWARFGQLFLDDGQVGGRRILPAGWVAMSSTPTLNTGYGAGWWTNRVPGLVPEWGVPWGLSKAPRDAFFARGFMGQFVVVIPSRHVVIVRLSVSHQRGDDIDATDDLVGDVLAALAGR